MLNEDGGPQFYALKRGWAFRDENAATRLMHLGQAYTSIEEHLDPLRDFLKSPTPESSRLAGDAITVLMNEVEAFLSVFPALETEDWFRDFRDNLAKAYWREEEHLLSSKPEAFRGFVYQIMEYADGPPGKSFLSLLYVFARDQGKFLQVRVADDLQADVDEARDLVSIGYHTTALLVLGRATERALFMLGQSAGIASVSHSKGGRKTWAETGFANMSKALRNGTSNGQVVAMLTKQDYHEIAVLVHHRNALAHKDYHQMPAAEAKRMLGNALALLVRLSNGLEHVPKLPESHVEIPEVPLDG